MGHPHLFDLKNEDLRALELAKSTKILGAGNSKWIIANAMPELRSVNRTLVSQISALSQIDHV